jgi:hypothetical protein
MKADEAAVILWYIVCNVDSQSGTTFRQNLRFDITLHRQLINLNVAIRCRL